MKSGDILKLLAEKHAEDVFVPECKDGPTQGGNHVRLDAWAMKKSWSHPLTVGYEIKVTKADFRRDEKWQAYLPLCNQLYFVCPPGVIDVAEVPPECGLMVTTTNCTRLLTKKKASHRGVIVPEDVYRYILMCRVAIRDNANYGGCQANGWRQWLAEKEDKRRLGKACSIAIHDTLRNRLHATETENFRLTKENEKLADVKRTLEALGFGAGWVPDGNAVKSRLEKARRVVPDGLRRTLESLGRDVASVMRAIDELDNEEK